MKKLCAEFLGTFVLVLFGCGTAIFAAKTAGGLLGIAMAFGLSVLVMIYAVGYISGGHFNPAVTVGLYVAKRVPGKTVGPYIGAQLLGAIFAAVCLAAIIATNTKAPGVGDFAANTYSTYTWLGAFLTEMILTFVFVMVILGTTEKGANTAFAGIAIGLTLVVIHLVSIRITNTSVNPARSTSQALFSANPDALKQLWLFWVAPIAGAAIAGFCHKLMTEMKEPTAKKKA